MLMESFAMSLRDFVSVGKTCQTVHTEIHRQKHLCIFDRIYSAQD